MLELVAAHEVASPRGVRTWVVELDDPGHRMADLGATLSAAERARAARIADAATRRRFIVRRGLLRVLLGAETGIAPGQLEVVPDRHGKPGLRDPGLAARWPFSLSHARGIAAVAIGEGDPVGVDVAWAGGSTPIDGIARRFFSAPERRVLRDLPERERRRRFFEIWVRKEAYLKGRGEGISEWIHDTDFSRADGTWDPGDPAPGDQRAWLVRDLTGLPEGYCGSVAVKQPAEG